MNHPVQALMLIGSPKGLGSSSNSLGDFLANELSEAGLQIRTLNLRDIDKEEGGVGKLMQEIEKCNLIILSFPLYWDSLPWVTVSVLEKIAPRLRARETRRKIGFVALCNSGFPEASQSETAQAICRQFCTEAGLTWLGGLSLGGGSAIDGKPLNSLGGMTRHAKKGLRLAARNLIADEPVSKESIEIVAKPFIPRWLYTFLGSCNWLAGATKNGALMNISAQPYSTDE